MRPGLRFKVLARDNYTCRYCGAKAPDVKLHVDHVVPRAAGGSNALSNLVTACETCNLGKSSHMTEQAAPELSEEEFQEALEGLYDDARSWFTQDLGGICDEWRDFTGNDPSRRETVALGRLVLGFSFAGVRRVMRAIGQRQGFEPDQFIELDLFEIGQMLRRWHEDGHV